MSWGDPVTQTATNHFLKKHLIIKENNKLHRMDHRSKVAILFPLSAMYIIATFYFERKTSKTQRLSALGSAKSDLMSNNNSNRHITFC